MFSEVFIKSKYPTKNVRLIGEHMDYTLKVSKNRSHKTKKYLRVNLPVEVIEKYDLNEGDEVRLLILAVYHKRKEGE